VLLQYFFVHVSAILHSIRHTFWNRFSHTIARFLHDLTGSLRTFRNVGVSPYCYVVILILTFFVKHQRCKFALSIDLVMNVEFDFVFDFAEINNIRETTA